MIRAIIIFIFATSNLWGTGLTCSAGAQEDVKPLTYKLSDGTTLTGWLSKPGKGGDRKMPAVLLIPGGASLSKKGDERFGPKHLLLQDEVQRHLASKYVVLAVEYKSDYFGDRAEFESISEAYRELAKLPFVDAGRIAVMGVSHGGFLSLLATLNPAYDVKAKTVVSVSGVVDLAMHVKFWEKKIRENPAKFGNYDTYGVSGVKKALGWPPEENESTGKNYASRSALTYASNLRFPLLLIHGEYDDYVPFSHTEALAKALEKDGKKFELKKLGRFGSNHFLVLKNARVWGWITEFLDNTL